MFPQVRLGAFDFTVCDPYGDWNEVAGIYVFSRQFTALGIVPMWSSEYVGETNSFHSRLSPITKHEYWAEAVERGATHVLAVIHHGDTEARRADEKKLIGLLNPPINQRHRTSVGLGSLAEVLADQFGGFGRVASFGDMATGSLGIAPPPNHVNALRALGLAGLGKGPFTST